MAANEVKRLAEGNETWQRYWVAASGGTPAHWAKVCVSAEIKYLVLNHTNKRAAIEAVLNTAPATYGANANSSGNNGELRFKEVRFDGYDGEESANVKCTAVYSNDNNQYADDSSEGEATMSFDCGGGTKHVVHAIKQGKIVNSAISYAADDAGGGIGWNGKSGSEAEFSGVDVPTADMREVYTKLIPISKLTASYKKSLATLTGKVNNATFKGYEAGEVMFLGMSYTAPVKGQKKVMATYNFRISPNETNVKISGQTYSVSKKGWQYAWARSKMVNNANSGTPQVEIDGVYISDVCESADFSVLGL